VTYHKLTLKSGYLSRSVVIEGDRVPKRKDQVRVRGEGDRVWRVAHIERTEPLYLERVS